MATSSATKFLRSFPQRYGMKQSWFQSVLQARRTYWTGDRYQGYVSFFQPDELFGFVVREDLPDKEYYFHSTDLHCRNVPRVRPLQQVEFSIVEGRGGNYIARDVTGPDSSDIEFNHPNMRLPTTERTRLLSSLPNGLHERHKGVVVTIHADGSGGLIVPDRLNFQVVSFRMNEVQSTGYEKLDRFSEVEFFVRPGRYENTRDRGVCITRAGGGLITGERKDVGQRRRQLGAMYGPNDSKARIPPEFQKDRQRGIVVQYNHDKLFGFIACVDKPHSDAMFVHCDDCHIAGKRLLRKGQLVEFVAVSDEETQRTKALHVSGINQTVIHSISDNHYLPRDLTTMEYEPDNNKTRHKGTIMTVDRNRRAWFAIKPNERGYQPVFCVRSEFNALGMKIPEVGMAVEFGCAPFERRPKQDENENENENSNENTDNNKTESTIKAVHVTAEGGFPLLTQRGRYGRYLQSKIGLPIIQADLELAPISTDKTVQGYISSYSRQRQFGTLEIEAPDGQRYQKAKFRISDCVLPDNIEAINASINNGLYVKCNINETGPLTEEEEEIQSRGGLLLARQATNITSVDLDYLECREAREVSESSEQQPLSRNTVSGLQGQQLDDDDLKSTSTSKPIQEDHSWETEDEKTIAL